MLTMDDAIDILTEERTVMQKKLATMNKNSAEYQNQKTLSSALGMAIDTMSEWEKHLDISYDYEALAKQYQNMMNKYETEDLPIKEGDSFLCPACHRKIRESDAYCSCCGKRVGWKGLLKKSGKKPQTIKRKGKRR